MTTELTQARGVSISCCQVKVAFQKPHRDSVGRRLTSNVNISDELLPWKGRKSLLWQMRRHQQDTTTNSVGRENPIFRTRRWPLPGRRQSASLWQAAMQSHVFNDQFVNHLWPEVFNLYPGAPRASSYVE